MSLRFLVFPKAPGEALAELASMNRLSRLDIVMSEDSDAFAYGAEVLARRYVRQTSELCHY